MAVKVLKKITEGLHGLGAGILTLIFVLVVVDVLTRTAGVSFIKDVGELAGIGVVMLTYLAVPLAMREEKQIRVDLVVSHFSRARQRIVRIVTDVIMVGFSLFMCWMGGKMVTMSLARGLPAAPGIFPRVLCRLFCPWGCCFWL